MASTPTTVDRAEDQFQALVDDKDLEHVSPIRVQDPELADGVLGSYLRSQPGASSVANRSASLDDRVMKDCRHGEDKESVCNNSD
jgi:hypothetical protein